MFIVIEGIDGSGKSTLQAGLAERLRAEGYDVLETQEPGGTALGNKLRDIFLNSRIDIQALPAALMLNAARAQHVDNVIRPAIAEGRVVLCDRFTDSTLAYQGYGVGRDLDDVKTICDIATGGLKPDFVLLLDVPLEVATLRLRARSRRRKDRMEKQGVEFQLRVRRGFLELARAADHRILDGTLAPDRLIDLALEEVRIRLQKRMS